jgi:cytochrome c biogenesis protein CcmG/thiol:disulfide interchange protein DsbE
VPEVPRFSWRVLLVSTTVALILAVVAGLIVSKATDDDSTSTVRPDQVNAVQLNPDRKAQPLDKVTFTTFDGKEVKLASLKGKPLVVNFFASYCTPCIKEMPALQKVHRQTGDRVQFLGLAVSDRISEARRLIARTKITYPTAQDPDADVLTAVNAYNLPTTVLIDAAGKIVGTHTGALTSSQLRSLLADKLGITT